MLSLLCNLIINNSQSDIRRKARLSPVHTIKYSRQVSLSRKACSFVQHHLAICSLSKLDFEKLVCASFSTSSTSGTLLVCRRSEENWLMRTDGQVRLGRTASVTCPENLLICTGLTSLMSMFSDDAAAGGCFSFLRFTDLSPMEMYRMFVSGLLYR